MGSLGTSVCTLSRIDTREHNAFMGHVLLDPGRGLDRFPPVLLFGNSQTYEGGVRGFGGI